MQMLIDGASVDSSSGKTMPIINPATEEIIDIVPSGNEEDTRRAIDAAYDAFEKSWWSSMHKSRERGRILWRFKEMVRAKENELAVSLTREQGKVLRESISEVRSLQNTFEYYAGFGGKVLGNVTYIEDGENILEVKNVKKPIGVCAAIVPFNFPLSLMAWKVAPALIAGNAVVVKPSSTTPLTDIQVLRMLHDAGVPKGVINVITGPSSIIGKELVENDKVRKVAFTGSTETGKEILRQASKGIKKVTLELGGSDPSIVCESADIQKAASTIASARFRNTGQSCTAVKRVFVMRSIYDKFINEITTITRKMKVGNGLLDGVDMGPLNTNKQRELTEKLVSDALDRGAKLLAGGSRPRDLAKGFFYNPTVVSDVQDDALILKEECFGPALPVTPVDNIDEAIARANNSQYGLGATLWTTSESDRIKVERFIQSGMLWINYKPLSAPEAPFGGIKNSGIGRELGFEGLEEYLETLSIRALYNP
ncbi:MAG: aldehyde dehydrogenase family protein [Conexivisphaerales archaeon]